MSASANRRAVGSQGGAASFDPCPACSAVNPRSARFCSACGQSLTADEAPHARGQSGDRAPGQSRPLDTAGERRQLTVMFCDLVNSTTLASQIDPEDLHEVIGAYQRCIVDVVTRFNGFVARFVGDGALVYFGYPHAREDDAEHAIRAGLGVVEAVSQLVLLDNYTPQVRVGIATGLVVVGSSAAAGALHTDVTGETPNLAARLQSLAESNTVVVAASTRRLAGGLFVYRDLGPLDLKGFAEPVPVWRVLSASAAESRFHAGRDASAPILGRESEIEVMMRRWREAGAGRGQALLLCGEPGIGKSRLTAMLEERLGREPHARLRYFCSPDAARTPLHPCVKQLERVAGFVREDSPARKFEKLQAALAPGHPGAEDLALIADLLLLPAGGGVPKLQLSPQRRREKTMDALLRWLEVFSRDKRVLMIFEDAQWSDPTSYELLDRLIGRIVGLPVLLVCTYRPEFRAIWADRQHVTTLTLSPLAPAAALALVEHIAGKGNLPPAVVGDIVARADGVPLFLEELTKAVVEGSADAARKAPPARAPQRAAAVPATLHASLMARLDRLGSAKEIAQLGAAVGREFSYELIAAVAGKSDAELQAALERLSEAGLVFRRRDPPHAIYLFKHALIRDAAYGTLLRDTRRALHRRIVDVLEGSFPDTVAAHPESLAQHCADAGLAEKAVGYWLKAGQHALARSALAEAMARLQKGLDLLASLPETKWRNQCELDVQLALGSALIATKGYVAPATVDAFARARALCKVLQQSPQLVSVLHGQWAQSLMRNELAAARRRAAELLDLGEANNDLVSKWTGHRLLGTSCFPLGEFAAGRDHVEQSLALYDAEFRPPPDASEADETQAARLRAFDEGHVLALVYSAYNLLYLGQIDLARRRVDEALQQARRRSQAYTLAHALTGQAFIELMTNSPRAALESLEQLGAVTEGADISYYSAMGTVFRGWCLAAMGRDRDGIAEIKRGLADYRAMGNRLYVPSFLKYLAEAHGWARQPKEGLMALAEASEIAAASQGCNDEAEIHRVRAELLAIDGDTAGAEQSFRAALAVARRQEARFLELRAAAGLARLWRDQGEPAKAREVLAPAYGWFTGGLKTAALADAKALLDTLV